VTGNTSFLAHLTFSSKNGYLRNSCLVFLENALIFYLFGIGLNFFCLDDVQELI